MISYDATLAPATQLVQSRCHQRLLQHWSTHSVGAWLSPSSCRIFSKDLRDIRKLSVHYLSLNSLFLPLSAASPRCAPASKISVRSVIPLMVARLAAGSGACCTTWMRWSLFSRIAANTLRALLCKSRRRVATGLLSGSNKATVLRRSKSIRTVLRYSNVSMHTAACRCNSSNANGLIVLSFVE